MTGRDNRNQKGSWDPVTEFRSFNSVPKIGLLTSVTAAVWERNIPPIIGEEFYFPTSQEYDDFEHVISWDVCQGQNTSPKSLFTAVVENTTFSAWI